MIRKASSFTILLYIVMVFLPLAQGWSQTTHQPDQGWVRDILTDYRCDPEVATRLATATRLGVEREVRRGERSIKPPTAVGELSCLNNLMNSPQLDLLFSTGSISPGNILTGILNQVLSGGSSPFGNLDINALANGGFDPTRVISSSLCQLAQDRWNQETIPLLGSFARLGIAATRNTNPTGPTGPTTIQSILQTGR